MPERSYTAAEVDMALEALVEPGRLAHAQDVVVHAAPALQRILAEALSEGGWFGEAHDAEIRRIAREQDEQECVRALSTLVAEQTRLGMFVGVAVGFELAHELAAESEPLVEDPLGREPSGVATGDAASSGAHSPKDQLSTEEH
ncbi:MAG TPA: hypothetical protein VK691_10460 [Solirubrobacteraceae bacterium]|nr:hypothetical protein [Solirubrobacteraceae bacterium]